MLANIKMGIPSRSLVLFEINALVTAEIKRNGQIVHCLAKIQDTIETGNPQAVVTLHKMPFLIPIINQAPDKYRDIPKGDSLLISSQGRKAQYVARVNEMPVYYGITELLRNYIHGLVHGPGTSTPAPTFLTRIERTRDRYHSFRMDLISHSLLVHGAYAVLSSFKSCVGLRGS